MLPGTATKIAVTDPSELPLEADQFDYISHPRSALPYVSMKLKEAEQSGVLEREWRAVMAYYEEDPYWSSVIKSYYPSDECEEWDGTTASRDNGRLIRGIICFQCVTD